METVQTLHKPSQDFCADLRSEELCVTHPVTLTDAMDLCPNGPFH